MALRDLLASAAVAAAGMVGAVECGDVLSFAGGGGLRQVSVTRQLSETSFAGTLDGYAGTLNATVVVTDEGWRLDADDWKAGCSWRVVGGAAGMSVECLPKARRTARSCPVHGASRLSEAGAFPRHLNVSGGWTAGWEADPVENEIDILVVFDKKAQDWLSKTGRSPKAFAEAQIAKMNLTLANSGLSGDFAVRLAGVFESDIDVTRDCGRKADDYLEEALERVIESSDAKWRAIRETRERTGADVVMVLVDADPSAGSVDEIDGTLGISNGLMVDPEHGRFGLDKAVLDEQREMAYGVCNVRIVESDGTFVHEVGHILGAGHSDLLSPDYSAPGPQLFTYSSALMYLDRNGAHYYTTMGYDSTDGEEDSPTYEEIPYFSSPDLTHPETGTVLGDAAHDNVRTLRETYAIVSQFRVNDARRTTPWVPTEPSAAWSKARVLTGVLAQDGVPQGLVTLKIGKMNAKNQSVRVSGTLTGLDGRKLALKADAQPVVTRDAITVSLTIKGQETPLTASVSADGITALSQGAAALQPDAMAGGALATATPVFVLPESAVAALSASIGGLQDDLLPTAEAFSAVAGKWVFAKAAAVKWAKDRETKEYGRVVDTSKDKTNLSGLKLSYAEKTGLFKGSFKAYALVENGGRTSLKKYTVNVTGMVVGGKGYGQISCRKPAVGSVAVTVE